MNKLLILNLLICATLSASELNAFNFNKTSNSNGSIYLEIDIDSHSKENGYDKITNNFNSYTTDIGMPELPSYSTFYQLNPHLEYEFELIIHDSYLIEDIKVYPHQGFNENSESFLINNEFYSSSEPYPSNNIQVSNRMHSRGIDMVSIEVTPFNFFSEINTLEVLTSIEILIHEVGERATDINPMLKRSRVFDSLLSDFIINHEPSSREEDYQLPSILYICGGNSENNSYLQDLMNWKHEQGYVVRSASLSETGNSANSIKNYIQDAYYNWENPPEYIALVGDVGGSYSLPTFYNGHGHNSYGNECEGDLPYSQLNGNDLIPEVIIGRISIRSSGEIGVVTTKIMAYEKASYIDFTGTDWYEKAALIGDPSPSGNSTVHTNQYISNILNNHGIENIAEEYQSGFDNFMEDQLEDGVLYINYRGYLGVSGFDNNDVNSANNGFMTPFSTILTCGTGSFAEDNTCLSEAMLRYGSTSSPRGAVAAIGTATWNTHTLFNNIVDMGIYDGIFSKNLPTVGLALANGKLSLLNTYPTDPDEWVSAFTQWNNLMGDPSVALWTDTPLVFSVEHPSSLNIGENIIDINITNNLNQPIENARVTLLKGNDEIFKSSLSNENGNINFTWDGEVSSGDITLTITKRNFIPYQETINIIDNQNHLVISDIQIDDSQTIGGNHDGFINPGEYIELYIHLENLSDNPLTNISASIDADFIFTDSISIAYENVNPNSITNPNSPFMITLGYDILNNQNLNARLNLNINGIEYSVSIPLEVFGSYVNILNYSTNNHQVTIGELNTLNFNISNSGSITLDNLIIELLPVENLITVISSIVEITSLYPGIEGSAGPFEISVNPEAISGMVVPMDFIITNNQGFYQTHTHNIELGLVSQSDPFGPDLYGYYIYDSGDTAYDIAPTYDWIELNNGLGTEMDFHDTGDGNGYNLFQIVELPFEFRFYGLEYNEITVYSDGYISFGDNQVPSHRNYPIPGAGGPSPMIAAFWDDLKTTTNSSKIFKHITEEYAVIQWDNLKTYENNSNQTFEMILFNSDFSNYPTATNDGEIKIQYKDFNNTSDGNWSSYPPMHGQYCTIGIENSLGNIGLEYSYNNTYSTASMPISDNTALLITTGKEIVLIGDLNSDGEINILDVISLVNIILGTEGENSAGDFNQDGEINILDVVLVVEYILNQ